MRKTSQEQARAWRESQIKKGLCSECKNPIAKGSASRCKKHLAYAREIERKSTLKEREAKRCKKRDRVRLYVDGVWKYHNKKYCLGCLSAYLIEPWRYWKHIVARCQEDSKCK